jgi:DNA mismatch endonuclease (patch repair protein)
MWWVDSMPGLTRGEIMSRIGSGIKKNRFERRGHNWLCGMKVKHRMQPKIIGKPDVQVFLKHAGFYIFLDGCFWHMCPRHYKRPKSNRKFWINHIEKSNNRRELMRKTLPYRWIRVWEHDMNLAAFKNIINKEVGKMETNSKGKKTIDMIKSGHNDKEIIEKVGTTKNSVAWYRNKIKKEGNSKWQ